jgi:ABC-type antimicrobial peptide transport system permease subunit
MVAALATSLGALALILASVGVYGVVAYAVSRRLREIGIRMALGAGERGVLWLIVRQTMRPVAIGAVFGLAISFGVSRALSSVLFGVSALDPIAVIGATAVVLGIALAAGALPVWRATQVDPIAALRHE